MSTLELEVRSEAAIDPSRVRRWKQYSTYRDSGVEWLGEVPAHWTAMRFKYATSSIQMGPFGGMLKDLYYVDTGFKVYGQENTINNDFEAGHRWITQTQYLDLSRYSLVPGDIVLTRKGSIGKCRVFPAGAQPGIADSDTIRVRLDSDAALTPFVVRLLHDAWYLQEQIRYASRGAILSGLNTATISELYLTLPPLPEQRIIAAFLDRETARIDALIANKERLIELLQEKRTALISHAVTKGLDPGAPMRDSGVEWLGEVPAHWEMKRLKHFVRFYGGGTPSKENLEFWNGDIPWVSPKDMKSEEITDTEDHVTPAAIRQSASRLVDPGVVLIVVRSGILRHTIPVAINRRAVALNQDMKAIVPLGAATAEYLKYIILGNQRALLVAWRKAGATVESIEHELLANEELPLPPVPEQRAITVFLDCETARIDALLAKVREHIARLHEYRTALISAAVTGKIDVREEVAA